MPDVTDGNSSRNVQQAFLSTGPIQASDQQRFPTGRFELLADARDLRAIKKSSCMKRRETATEEIPGRHRISVRAH